MTAPAPCAICGAIGDGNHHNGRKHLAWHQARERELMREDRHLEAVPDNDDDAGPTSRPPRINGW